MSKVVDQWVERLKGKTKPVGEMTHWERMAAAFDLKETDMVPVAPELDYWQITYAGYSHKEIYNDVDKTTDACIKTWADLRCDAIWMYVDISHQIEHFIPAEKRPEYFIHRGKDDYLLFKPIAHSLDEAIALFEQRVWEKYIDGSRPVTHYTPHMLQLLEFQEKMDRQVPVIVGIGTPTNYAETVVEVQNFLKWMVTEPEDKIRYYLDLVLKERLASLDFYAEFAAKNGAQFCCGFGGARTWGPKHLEKFGDVDRIWVDKAKTIFPYVFWHICGHNLPKAMETVSSWDGIKAIQYDMPYYGQEIPWSQWCEQMARLMHGRQCAMNSPTTQMACHGTPSQVSQMVAEFIDATLPHTTACVMPGCEIDSFSPVENLRAMINTARSRRGSA
ncbi:MAG: uroporphyrinogen decarboxylase family protein [Phycisphaerae bacterium]|nr:uroporphyrinogen decarboxylase family protein [Phycisphaerae bacterium]